MVYCVNILYYRFIRYNKIAKRQSWPNRRWETKFSGQGLEPRTLGCSGLEATLVSCRLSVHRQLQQPHLRGQVGRGKVQPLRRRRLQHSLRHLPGEVLIQVFRTLESMSHLARVSLSESFFWTINKNKAPLSSFKITCWSTQPTPLSAVITDPCKDKSLNNFNKIIFK